MIIRTENYLITLIQFTDIKIVSEQALKYVFLILFVEIPNLII